MDKDLIPGRVALQQRVLPAYRAPFFDSLAVACEGGLSVFAGDPLPQENINTSVDLRDARYYVARNHHFMSPSSPLYRCRQDGILEWLEEWCPQVLIVEANPRNTSTPGAVQWMHKRGHPVIGWGLGAPPVAGLLGFWRNRVRNHFLHSLDGVIAYSRRGEQQYRSLGIPSERVFTAVNAVSPRPTHPMPDRPVDFDGKSKLLFVGRLQFRKRIDNLLMACAALPYSLQPGLWIIGDGPARDEFMSIAEKVFPSAEFLGALNGAALDDYFTRADIFVLPGTGGLAVQQAMAFGLPVIVAEGDGTQDDLVSSDNGWLVPAGDVRALTGALKEALSNTALLRRMGEASYRLVSEEINLQAMVDVFVRALSTIKVKK